MRRILFLLFIFPMYVAAQTLPAWYDAASRRATYPPERYITGFSVSQLAAGESPTKAMNALQEKARVNAVSTIQVRVKNDTEDRLEQLQYKGAEGNKSAMARYLQSVTHSSVDLEITGLQIETCHDTQKNRVAAFAYVKISDLLRQTDRKLTATLSKIEIGLDEMDQLVANGQKMQARERGEKLAPMFVSAEDAQRILIAVDEFADAESLQTALMASLQKRYIKTMADLKNGIGIYLVNHASLFESSYPELASQIKGCLSSLGCEFVTNVDKSDWEITVISKPYVLKQAIENSFFCRLNATLKITKRATGQCVYEARVYNDAGMDVKGGSTTNNDDAAVDAYKNLTTIICDIIKQQIQQ